MSYRDVRLALSKASDLIAVLGIKRAEVNSITVVNLACLTCRFDLEVECFIRLCRKLGIRPDIRRDEDWLNGEFRYRDFAFFTHVWSKETSQWDALNASSLPTLEVKVKRTAISVQRTAIADKRRLIGLPAPKVIDV